MTANQRLLNPLKTEYLQLGGSQQQKKFEWFKFSKVGDYLVGFFITRQLFLIPLSLTGYVKGSFKSAHVRGLNFNGCAG